MGDIFDPATQSRYSMSIEWSPEDDAFIVTVPELPGCRTHGATYDEAVRQGQDAIGTWADAALEDGDPLPAPRHFDPEPARRAWWGSTEPAATT